MSDGYTVIVFDAAENAFSCAVAESITSISKLYMLPAESVSAGMVQVTVLPADWPLLVFEVHCVALEYTPLFVDTYQVYEYGEVPVEGIVLVMVSA